MVKKYIFMPVVIILLLSVTISGVYFPSEDSYSYVNSIESLGEQRSITRLIFSNNRKELKNKIDSYVFESKLRNGALNVLASASWNLQDNLFLDTQFFNTEIFYGVDGELYPKINECNQITTEEKVKIKSEYKSKFIFLLVPLKQEIEMDTLNYLQKKYLCDAHKSNFYKFTTTNNEMRIIDLYKSFSGGERYYERGDTHWNSLGLNLVLIELLSNTNPTNKFYYQQNGTYTENNKVLERLGLIKLDKISNSYKVYPEPTSKIKLLIIHDSFFNSLYSPTSYLDKYFQVDYLNWSKNIDYDDELYRRYDFVILESSIDIFFKERIFYLKD